MIFNVIRINDELFKLKKITRIAHYMYCTCIENIYVDLIIQKMILYMHNITTKVILEYQGVPFVVSMSGTESRRLLPELGGSLVVFDLWRLTA